LVRCSINIFDRPLLQTLNEAAIWGAIRHRGLMENTVVVSDDAGQFRIAQHALCWIHAERHLQKLMPASPKQAKAVELVRDTIWCFYRGLKLWKQSPTPGAKALFRRQFSRIFGQRTGYKELDELLARLARRKDELLRVLERPEIPLHTNASEHDLRDQAQDLRRHDERRWSNGTGCDAGAFEDLPQARVVVLHLSRGSARPEHGSAQDPAAR